MKAPFAVILGLALLAPVAAQACTAEEAREKAQQLAHKIAEITQNDPERARELNEELRQTQMKNAPDDQNRNCEVYDQRIKDIDAAAKRAEPEMPDKQ